MSFMMDQKKSRKREKRASASLLDGSSSDDSDEETGEKESGMRAVSNLHRLHREIRRRPSRVCSQFEKDIVEELGVIPGRRGR